MAMVIEQKWFTVPGAASELGLTDGRIRQILREQNESGNPLGLKAGRDWLLSESDIARIRSLPDKRKMKTSKKVENRA